MFPKQLNLPPLPEHAQRARRQRERRMRRSIRKAQHFGTRPHIPARSES